MVAITTEEFGAQEKIAAQTERTGWPPALWALALGSFAIGTTEFLPAALLPTIASSLGVDIARAGLLVTGYALGVTVLTPLLTALFSTVPRKTLLILLMSAFVLTNGLAACSTGYWFLLVVRFFTAFSHGVFFAVASTASASLVPRGREARAIAILFGGLTIAMATVVPSGALIGQILGWRMAFGATSLLGLLAAIGIYWFVPELPASEKKLSIASQFQALRNRGLLLVLGMTTVGYTGTFATFTFLAATLEDVTGFAPYTVTILFAMLGVGVTVGNFLGGRIADAGLHRAIVLLYGLLAISFLAFWIVAPFPYLAVPALLAISVLMFSPGAGLQLLAVEQARRTMPEAVDVAAGLNQSAFNLGIAIGAFVGGQVVLSPLGLRATPLVSILFVVAAIGLTLVAWKDQARE